MLTGRTTGRISRRMGRLEGWCRRIWGRRNRASKKDEMVRRFEECSRWKQQISREGKKTSSRAEGNVCNNKYFHDSLLSSILQVCFPEIPLT